MSNGKFSRWSVKLKRVSLPMISVVAGPLILLGGALLSGQALFWGTPSLQFVPWWVEAWEQIRVGSLPLWNDFNGMGAPLAANYQSALFYPPNWILLIFAAISGAKGVAWGYTLLAAMHLAWGGLGMVALLRRLGAGELAQAVSGLAFGLSGYLVGRLEFFSMVWVAAWLPWIIRYADEIASPARSVDEQQKSNLSIYLVLALGMQMLAGHAQLTWYSILLTGAWVLIGALRGGWRKVAPAVLRLAIAGVLAAGLAAVQLAPTAEYLMQSQRSDEVDYEFAMTYSFWPWRFITMAAPDFFGNPGAGDYWGYASFWEDHAYLGVPVMLLAFSTIPAMLKRRREPATRSQDRGVMALLWGIVIVSFVLALGQNTPVFPFLFEHVPTFDMFQAPARYLIWASFGLAVLGGLGADRWRCPEKRGLYWLRLGTAGMFAVTLGAGIAWQTMGDVQLTFIRATALAGGWALGTGLFTLLIPLAEKHGKKQLWNVGVILWLAADLLVAGWMLNPTTSLNLYGESTKQVQAMREDLGDGRLFISDVELDDIKFKRFFRFKDFSAIEDWRNLRETILPNIGIIDRVASANNFDPLLPGRYSEWMVTLQGLDTPVWRQWLAWMNVRLVEQIDASVPGGVRFSAVDGGKRYGWYRCVLTVNDADTALAVLEQGENSERLVVEGNVPNAGQPCATEGGVQISEQGWKPNRKTIEVTADAPGWLMVSQTWYPGWIARVDGKRTTLLHANYLFVGLEVPAGQHTVELVYRPNSFVFGLLLSILVGIILLAWKTGWLDRISRYKS